MIRNDQAVKWKIKRISKYKAPHHTDKIILTIHPLWNTLEICCCHSGILKPCKLLDANISSGLKMAKNPKKLLGIARKKREPAVQKLSKLLYLLTVNVTPTWKLGSFCLSIWQMYSWTEKNKYRKQPQSRPMVQNIFRMLKD